MDIYNSRIARIFWFFNGRRSIGYAVTLGQTAYYSCTEDKVAPWWHAHENQHKVQWARDGKIKFLIRYLWQLITKGYNKIDYEIEAKEVASKINLGKE